MNQLTKYFVYFIILIKILFVIALIREKIIKDPKKNKNIETRVEIFHEMFLFLMFILLVIIFNPMNKNIVLDNDLTLSGHVQLIIFILGVLELLNLDYKKILKAPMELINSF
jgi:hypothetical protein